MVASELSNYMSRSAHFTVYNW